MHCRSTAAAVATALLLTLTACGTPEKDAGAKPATAEATEPKASTSTESAPEASPSAEKPFVFGDTWTFVNTEDEQEFEGNATVLGYKQGFKSVGDAAEETGESGYVWGAVELKTCSVSGTFLISSTAWTLYYEDGSRVEQSSSTWDDFRRPEYPMEATLRTGRCARGHLVFPVPGDSRPIAVMYAPGSLEGAAPLEWTVPAS